MMQKIIVSGILENSQNVFLAKRPLTKKTAPGIYHLPGGHVEFGEDPMDALVREFQEEFFLPITVGEVFRIFSYVSNDVHVVELTYEVTADSIPDVIEFDQRETESVHWVSKENIAEFLPDGDHDRVSLESYFLKSQ